MEIDNQVREGLFKLYILVRRDISPEQQAVQAGHAVAQFLKDNPNTPWPNGTLVYLSIKDDESTRLWEWLVNEMELDITIGKFFEPDMEHQATAMYAYGPDAEYLLRDLPLMRFS